MRAVFILLAVSAGNLAAQSNVIPLCDQQANSHCWYMTGQSSISSDFTSIFPSANGVGALANNGNGNLAYTNTVYASLYNYAAITPKSPSSLTGGGGAQTITLATCPPAMVSSSGFWAPVYLSGGTGTAEAVVPSGGTCTTLGGAGGTIIVSPTNNHSGAWTVASATSGVQEGVNSGGTSVFISSETPATFHAAVTITGSAHVSFYSDSFYSFAVYRASDYPTGPLFYAPGGSGWSATGYLTISTMGIQNNVATGIAIEVVWGYLKVDSVFCTHGTFIDLDSASQYQITHFNYYSPDAASQPIINITGTSSNLASTDGYLANGILQNGNSTGYGIQVTGADSLDIDNVTVDGPAVLVYMQPAAGGSYIANVRIRGGEYDAGSASTNCQSAFVIYGRSGTSTGGIIISGVTIVGYQVSPEYLAMDINTNYASNGNGYVEDLQIIGNHLTEWGPSTGSPGQGIALGNPPSGGDERIKISHNTITAMGGAGMSLYNVQGVAVEGNTLSANGGYGIYWGNTSAGANIIITGNNITGNTGGTIYTDSAPAATVVIESNRGINDVSPALASASSLALPINPNFTITGTTNVATITNQWPHSGTLLTTGGAITFTAGSTIGNTYTTSQNVPVNYWSDGTHLWLGAYLPTSGGTMTGAIYSTATGPAITAADGYIAAEGFLSNANSWQGFNTNTDGALLRGIALGEIAGTYSGTASASGNVITCVTGCPFPSMVGNGIEFNYRSYLVVSQSGGTSVTVNGAGPPSGTYGWVNGGLTGGYQDLAPIDYTATTGYVCYDAYGNPTNQPTPLNGLSAFGLGDVLIWNSPSPMQGWHAPFTYNAPTSANYWITGTPCAAPLSPSPPGSIGLNVDSYVFANGGLASGVTAFNAVQAYNGGGMNAQSFTAAGLYPPGQQLRSGFTPNPFDSYTTVDSSYRVSNAYGTYLGGYIYTGYADDNPGGSSGTCSSIATCDNPFINGVTLKPGEMAFNTSSGYNCEVVYNGTNWVCMNIVLAGTANEITVTLSAGNTYTFSTPQAIATTSNVVFETVTAQGTGSGLVFAETSGNFQVDGNGNVSLAGSGSVLAVNGSTGGVNVTADTSVASIQTVGGFSAEQSYDAKAISSCTSLSNPISGYGGIGYNTGSTYCYWNGSAWATVNFASSGGSQWTLTGSNLYPNSNSYDVLVGETSNLSGANFEVYGLQNTIGIVQAYSTSLSSIAYQTAYYNGSTTVNNFQVDQYGDVTGQGSFSATGNSALSLAAYRVGSTGIVDASRNATFRQCNYCQATQEGTPVRALGTVYQNTNAYGILVTVAVMTNTSGNSILAVVGNTSSPSTLIGRLTPPTGSTSMEGTITFPVMPSQYYEVYTLGPSTGAAIDSWFESY